MGSTITIIIVVIIAFFLFGRASGSKGASSGKTPRSQPQDQSAKQPDNKEWIADRWRLAEQHRQAGDKGIFRDWYFDPATDRQKERLKKEGYNKIPSGLTKGQASDLIGLTEPADDRNLDVLKFFKVSTKGMNQTKAQHEVVSLFQDPEKVQAWESRPPAQMQRECAKFFGIKLPKGTTAPQAEKLIDDHISELADNDDPKLEEWEGFENVVEELSDIEVLREELHIKKTSMALIKTALEELRQSGQSYRESGDDVQSVVDKLLELKPELERV